jgi:GR25 family glycosyltransferase involved in LPS biosynthesis
MKVLSLSRTPERLAAFRAQNPHIHAEYQPAIDGRDVGYVDFVPASLQFTPGALGCFLSHLAFWDHVAETAAAMTIFEDDAVIHSRFDELSNTILAGLPHDWHICIWGWNVDGALMAELLPGTSAIVAFDQDTLRTKLADFQDVDIRPSAYPLHRFHGTVAYAISPSGVEALRPLCVPAPTASIEYPMFQTFPNNGIDRTINAALTGKIRAFVCFPPLVVTANDRHASTVQPA